LELDVHSEHVYGVVQYYWQLPDIGHINKKLVVVKMELVIPGYK